MSDPDQLAEIEARRVQDLMAAASAEDHGLAQFIAHAGHDLDWLVGEVERLRRFPAVWAVRYGNYDPSEVIALYDNEQAAWAHAECSDDPLEVEQMQVRSTPPRRPDDPEDDQ
jgi:hypothetical protein